MRLFKLKKLKRVQGLHFTPDVTRLLAVGGAEVRSVETAVWLDLATGESPGRIDQFATGYAVTPDLTHYVLLGADEGGGVAPVQWTPLPAADAWHPAGFNPGPGGGVDGLAFDRTGEWVVISHEVQTLHQGEVAAYYSLSVWGADLWEPGGAVSLLAMDVSGISSVIALDAAGSRVAFGGGVDLDTEVTVIDLAEQREVYRFDPPGTVTRGVLFLPDGKLVVANGRYVYVLAADRPEVLLRLSGHPKQVNAVVLDPSGTRLLTASHDGSIRTWDAATGRQLGAFDWQVGPVTALAFAPDGLTCAAAGTNGRVVLWDAAG